MLAPTPPVLAICEAPRPARRRAFRAVAAAAVALGLFAHLAPAHAQSPMLQGWLAANTDCKSGPPDDPKTQQACKRRDQVGERLKRRHCVYQEDGDWWRCPH